MVNAVVEIVVGVEPPLLVVGVLVCTVKLVGTFAVSMELVTEVGMNVLGMESVTVGVVLVVVGIIVVIVTVEGKRVVAVEVEGATVIEVESTTVVEVEAVLVAVETEGTIVDTVVEVAVVVILEVTVVVVDGELVGISPTGIQLVILKENAISQSQL